MDWGEMKISEEQLALAHPRIFRRDWFLHFDDHLGLGPNVVRGIDERGAGFLIQSIFKARSFTGTLFHQHAMAGISKRAHTCRRQAYAILVVFDFFRKSDDHGGCSPSLRFSFRSRLWLWRWLDFQTVANQVPSGRILSDLFF